MADHHLAAFTHVETERSLRIEGPLAEVWQVAAHEFDQVDAWSSGVLSSEATPSVGSRLV